MARMSAEEVRQEKALQALYECKTVTEAAEKAGISRKTLYKYMNYDNDFIIQYRNMRREQIRDISDRLSDGAAAATDFIINLIGNEEASDSIRLNAAYKLLDLYSKYRDIEIQINAAVIKQNEGNNFETLYYPESAL